MSAMDDNDRLMAGTLPVDPEDDALPMLSGGARQEPLLFGDAEVPDFPLDALPPWLASGRPSKRCKHLPVCRRCSGSRFFRFTTAKKIAVEIKPGWCEPTNLYVAVALAPGEGKSPIFAAATAPLHEWERELRARVAPQMADAEECDRLHEERTRNLRKRAAKVRSDVERRAIEEELRALAVDRVAHRAP